MNFQEFGGVETVVTNFITMLEGAGEHCWAIRRICLTPIAIFNVMVVADMLMEMIFTLKTVVSSISMRVLEFGTQVVHMC